MGRGWFLVWWLGSRSPTAAQLTTTGLSGGGSFSGTIVPGPSTVLQHAGTAPGPVKTAIGPRRSKHITVKLTQLGSG